MTKIWFICSAILIEIFNVMAVWLLQIKTTISYSDPVALLCSVVVFLTGGIVAMFFIIRKDNKERNAELKHIYETTLEKANTTVNNNNTIVAENTKETKELRQAVQALPERLRDALKDR